MCSISIMQLVQQISTTNSEYYTLEIHLLCIVNEIFINLSYLDVPLLKSCEKYQSISKHQTSL